VLVGIKSYDVMNSQMLINNSVFPEGCMILGVCRL